MDKITQIQAYLKDNPRDNFLRHALALENIKLGNDDVAKDLFKAILNESPNYVGSYYHLAKLLERQQLFAEALEWYTKGMEAAKAANDKHAFAELQMAYEDLEDNM
jgi:tetratricopeptide (TPR) repeat protein